MAPAGRISKLFGHAGEVVINLYDTFPSEKFNIEEPLLVVIDSLTVPLFLEKFQRRGRSGALVSFADMDTPERVTELLGLEFTLSESFESDEEESGDEMYMDDLVGFTALFLGKELQGEITDFIDNEHNPLLVLSIAGNEVLIPATDELIASFDTTRRTVTFDPPEGLLELYIS
jgi:16S rRNA processing protein RimM